MRASDEASSLVDMKPSTAVSLLRVERIPVVALSSFEAEMSFSKFSQSAVLVSPSASLKSVIVSIPGPQSKESASSRPVRMSSPLSPIILSLLSVLTIVSGPEVLKKLSAHTLTRPVNGEVTELRVLLLLSDFFFFYAFYYFFVKSTFCCIILLILSIFLNIMQIDV